MSRVSKPRQNELEAPQRSAGQNRRVPGCSSTAGRCCLFPKASCQNGSQVKTNCLVSKSGGVVLNQGTNRDMIWEATFKFSRIVISVLEQAVVLNKTFTQLPLPSPAHMPRRLPINQGDMLCHPRCAGPPWCTAATKYLAFVSESLVSISALFCSVPILS